MSLERGDPAPTSVCMAAGRCLRILRTTLKRLKLGGII